MINSLDDVKYYSILSARIMYLIDYISLVTECEKFDAELDTILLSIHRGKIYQKNVVNVVIFKSEEEMIRFNILHTEWLYVV